MKDINLAEIAKKAGLELTSKGNIELGSNDQGYSDPPGGSIRHAAVYFYWMADGDFKAVIDDRYGSNQGSFQQNGGDTAHLIGADLNDAIELAAGHIADGGDSAKLRQAHRIAASEARATMRKIERAE